MQMKPQKNLERFAMRFINPDNVAVYDKLYQEYKTLHKYFGTGENDVMKRLNKIREDRLSE